MQLIIILIALSLVSCAKPKQGVTLYCGVETINAEVKQ